jgi:hypothetical protein
VNLQAKKIFVTGVDSGRSPLFTERILVACGLTPGPFIAYSMPLGFGRGLRFSSQRYARRWGPDWVYERLNHNCHHPRKRMIRYAAPLVIDPRFLGVLDARFRGQ